MTDKATESVLVTVPVTWQRICDLMCSGIEGGYSPWLHEIEHGRNPGRVEASCLYYQPAFWQGGGTYTAKFDKESDAEGEGTGRATIDMAALLAGLAIMAELEPHSFANFISDQGDAITGDVFLQCVLLGKVIYG